MKDKLVFCWSGGKDSALALHRLQTEGRYEVVSLLTTCNEHFQRVSMHGVRVDLLDQQARSLGLPLEKVFVSQGGSNDEYVEKMKAQMLVYKGRGVTQLNSPGLWGYFSGRPQTLARGESGGSRLARCFPHLEGGFTRVDP